MKVYINVEYTTSSQIFGWKMYVAITLLTKICSLYSLRALRQPCTLVRRGFATRAISRQLQQPPMVCGQTRNANSYGLLALLLVCSRKFVRFKNGKARSWHLLKMCICNRITHLPSISLASIICTLVKHWRQSIYALLVHAHKGAKECRKSQTL